MKIAVVDDERPARKELISQILDVKPDCIVKEADSGGSALELFNKEDDFDMLFIDINLNDMEGTTLAATVKKLLPQAKIVFATAYSRYAAKAFEMEIDDYILKPFDPDRVRHVIEKCMKDPEQSKEQAEAVRGIAVGASVRIPVQVNHSIRFLDVSQIIYGKHRGGGHCFIQKQEVTR